MMKPTNARWVEVNYILPLWQSKQVQPEILLKLIRKF